METQADLEHQLHVFTAHLSKDEKKKKLKQIS